jgi:tRNA(fMet)-specific endonuclease VapC
MKKTWMLDTNICSFIMRERPAAVLKRLEQAVLRNHRIVVSAMTYSEMRFGATGPKASRATFSWLTRSAPASMPSAGPRRGGHQPRTLKWRCLAGTPIGPNDTLIAGRHCRRCRYW